MPSYFDDFNADTRDQRRLNGAWNRTFPTRNNSQAQRLLSKPRGIGMPSTDADFYRNLSPQQRLTAWHSQAIFEGYHTPQGENITYNMVNPAHIAEFQLAREAVARGQRPAPFGANRDAARSRVSQPQRSQDPDYNTRGSGFVGSAGTRNLGTRYIGEGGRDLGAYYGGGGERLPSPSGAIGLAGSLRDTTTRPVGQGAWSGVPAQTSNIAPNPFGGRSQLSLGSQPLGDISASQPVRSSATEAPFSYRAGQAVAGVAKYTARTAATDVANLYTGARNIIGVPAYNVLAGAFGAQPSQPRRYFDY